MKKQLIVIHGGETFETYDEYLKFLKDFELDFERTKQKKWKGGLQEELGDDYEVIALQMPNGFNAKYLEWKIWFDKHLPFFNEGLIFLGHSLGGTFLAKYLSENKLGKKITATLLVAAPFDDKDEEYTLADFNLSDDLSLLEEQGGKIILYQSKDDPVVPFADSEKFEKALPSIELKIFEDRGHFNQEEFPEIISDIKSL